LICDFNPGFGERPGEPFKPFARTVIKRHFCAQEPDPPIPCFDNGLCHLAPRPSMRNADGAVDWLAINIHNFDHRDIRLAQHCARGFRMFKPCYYHARGPP
tara:strand:- start:215 stop:517 length:303 start_codon:yes stop_codon:yes gene_type:complete